MPPKSLPKKNLTKKSLYEIKITPALPMRHIGIVTLKNQILSFATKKLIGLMLE